MFNSTLIAGRITSKFIVKMVEESDNESRHWFVHAYDIETGKSILTAWERVTRQSGKEEPFIRFNSCLEQYRTVCDFLRVSTMPGADDKFLSA